MNKKTSNTTTFRNWIKSASVQGIVRAMQYIDQQSSRFSQEQNDAIQALIKRELLTTATAKHSAKPAEETGVEGWDAISALLDDATFTEVKACVHAIDVRFNSLPQAQKDEVGMAYEPDPLAQLLGLGGDNLGLVPGVPYSDEGDDVFGDDPESLEDEAGL